MTQTGINHVKQLDGGILRYFEKTAGPDGQAPHWQGACFVFDERINVPADIHTQAKTKAKAPE
jgi:predicted sulfurtransferase